MAHCALALSHGRVPFLSQQLLDELDARGRAGAARVVIGAGLMAARGMKPTLAAWQAQPGGDARDLFMLGRDRFMIARLDDPLLPALDLSKGDAVGALLANGETVFVDVDAYLELALDTVGANWVVGLHEAVLATANRKREEKAVKRTIELTRKTLDAFAAREGGAVLLAPVVGVTQQQGTACVEALLKAPQAAPLLAKGRLGVSFPALGIAPQKDRQEIVRAALDAVRATAPSAPAVASLGSCGPLEMLEVLALGVDVVESTLPLTLTKLGIALTFQVELQGDEAPARANVNMRDPEFARDAGPLLAGCTCWACEKHTRGYVHHLLNTREMLAEMLLFTHNAHLCMELAAYVGALPLGERPAYVAAWSAKHQST